MPSGQQHNKPKRKTKQAEQNRAQTKETKPNKKGCEVQNNKTSIDSTHRMILQKAENKKHLVLTLCINEPLFELFTCLM